MALYPITINTPENQEPHIYAQDDACIYEAIFGSDCVFDMGNKFKSQVLSNNKIRLSDGVLKVGGHIARIKSGDYEDLTIANGVSGKKRVDIICCKFTTNGKVDNMELIVKQGAIGTSYTDPALTQNDLYAGGQVREMPLYRVKIDGLNIVAVEQMFELRQNTKQMQEIIEFAVPVAKNTVVVNFNGSSETSINVSLPEGYLIPICTNGDTDAHSAFVIGSHITPDKKKIIVKTNMTIYGNLRINYVVFKI